MNCTMTSIIEDSIVNSSTAHYRKSSSLFGHTWPPQKLFVAQTVIIVGSSSPLAHISWITPNNACFRASSRAGVHGTSTMITLLYIFATYAIYFRCTAPSDDLDGGWFIQQSEDHTELLCETYEMQELWDDYGIVGHVKVTISPQSRV